MDEAVFVVTYVAGDPEPRIDIHWDADVAPHHIDGYNWADRAAELNPLTRTDFT